MMNLKEFMKALFFGDFPKWFGVKYNKHQQARYKEIKDRELLIKTGWDLNKFNQEKRKQEERQNIVEQRQKEARKRRDKRSNKQQYSNSYKMK